MVILIVVKGPDQGKVFHIDGDGPIRIERALDLKLKDQKVSRNHLEIMRDNGGWFVQDEGSRTGTLLNGEKIESRMALTNGATLRLGRTTLVFAVVPESARVASQPHASNADSSVIVMVESVDEHATGDAAGNVAAEWSQNDAKVQRLLESVVDRLDRLPPPPNYDDELAEIRAVLSALQQPAPQSDGRLRQKIADLATRFETVAAASAAAAAVSPPQYDDELAHLRDAIAKVQSGLAGDHTVDDEQRGLLTRIIDRLESLHSLASEPSEVPAPPDFTQVIDALRQIVRDGTDTQSAPLLAQLNDKIDGLATPDQVASVCEAVKETADTRELAFLIAAMDKKLADLPTRESTDQLHAELQRIAQQDDDRTDERDALAKILDKLHVAAADQRLDELAARLSAISESILQRQAAEDARLSDDHKRVTRVEAAIGDLPTRADQQQLAADIRAAAESKDDQALRDELVQLQQAVEANAPVGAQIELSQADRGRIDQVIKVIQSRADDEHRQVLESILEQVSVVPDGAMMTEQLSSIRQAIAKVVLNPQIAQTLNELARKVDALAADRAGDDDRFDQLRAAIVGQVQPPLAEREPDARIDQVLTRLEALESAVQDDGLRDQISHVVSAVGALSAADVPDIPWLEARLANIESNVSKLPARGDVTAALGGVADQVAERVSGLEDEHIERLEGLAQPALAAQGDVHELRQATSQMRDELAQLEKSRNVAQQVLVEKFQEAETQSQKQLSEVLDEVRAAATATDLQTSDQVRQSLHDVNDQVKQQGEKLVQLHVMLTQQNDALSKMQEQHADTTARDAAAQADQARDELIEKLFAAMRFVQMQQQRLEQMVQPAGAESSPEPASPTPLPKTAALAQAKPKPANASPILTKPALRVAPPADRSQSSPPAAAPIARPAPQPVTQAPVPSPIEELVTADVGDDGQVILPVQEGVRNRPFTANMSARQISISAVIALFVLIAAFWFGKTTGFTTDLLETSEQATEPLDQPDGSVLRDLERTDAKTGSSQPTLGDLRLSTEEQW